MAEKWKWLGLDAMTNKTAIKKVNRVQRLSNQNENNNKRFSNNAVVFMDEPRNDSDCFDNYSVKRKSVKRQSVKRFKKHKIKYKNKYKDGGSYYEQFKYAPSSTGIKFYGTKP